MPTVRDLKSIDGVVTIDTPNAAGIKVGADWGWRDIEGLIYPDPANPSTAPSVALFRTGVYGYAYADSDLCHFSYHLPHDWKVGTDLYLHVHWSHNATNVAAETVSFDFDLTFAKGHDQESFPAVVSPSVTYALVDIATSPQYRHFVTEIQLSAASPSASQLDTDNLEVDGLIIGSMSVGIPVGSFTGATPASSLYVWTMDLHYQTTNIGTKNRTPNFYT